MRIGCCIPGSSFMPQSRDAAVSEEVLLREGSKIILRSGFDYAEAALGLVMALDEAGLERLSREMTLEVCNCFIPGAGTVIAGGESLREYVFESMRRMRMLGTKIVVFGSGRARAIPDGMSREEGMARIRAFLDLCQEAGAQFDIDVAIEPLNRAETNVVNRVSEATALAKSCGHPRVRVLADAFHMAREDESLESLAGAGELLCHVHVSEPDRSWPGRIGAYLPPFAASLHASGYRGRVSAECVFGDFAPECARAAAYMREIFDWE